MKTLSILLLTLIASISANAQSHNQSSFIISCSQGNHDIVISGNFGSSQYLLSYSTPGLQQDNWSPEFRGTVRAEEYRNLYQFENGTNISLPSVDENVKEVTGVMTYTTSMGRLTRAIVCHLP